ncbi:hypothetical protein GPECTOR_5g373 [Gonium pectorale]|uniref:Protein kinase domain-containing protein n=1 Tax=Gonium pectorale TaxID=33097 RepID=A0A150GWL1_GONPE|nr:hypothetical protein GPECTOR_5g373 [Gonium pectorale]|eukprot:KXZ54286.1 hypothetical protein GPECTOR_5g373 [Gonium pectorale]
MNLTTALNTTRLQDDVDEEGFGVERQKSASRRKGPAPAAGDISQHRPSVQQFGDRSAHGNSGRLRPEVSSLLQDNSAAVLSGAGDRPSTPRVAPAVATAAQGVKKAASTDVAEAGPISGATTRTIVQQLDVVAELGRMAQELKANVKDDAIKLETVIGCGSFGTVYKGIWQGLPVAVKTLVFSASNASRRRALQEAALCQSISHPNVVATYSSELQPLGPISGTLAGGGSAEMGNPPSEGLAEREMSKLTEWRLYIVQEFADGGPLRTLYGSKDLWRRVGEPNLPAVVALGLGIARALSHLHSKRIIHGDLNPNNVLLKRDSGEPSGFVVKVGDFGLSVMLPEHRTHLSNLRMGTMFYMCPAVVMKGQVGPSSDVFSLGVMLWELYHGRRAGTRTDAGPRYCSIFPSFPSTCPPAYSAVALHCLQRQPQNRPLAADVELRLEGLLEALNPGGFGGSLEA